LDIQKIDKNITKVNDYVFKSVKRGQFEIGEIVIFPKATSECTHTLPFD
jgi:hypothetical protein